MKDWALTLSCPQLFQRGIPLRTRQFLILFSDLQHYLSLIRWKNLARHKYIIWLSLPILKLGIVPHQDLCEQDLGHSDPKVTTRAYL